MLNYAVKLVLCVVFLFCAGCGPHHQVQVNQGNPQSLCVLPDQDQWVSYADAYPENWEHSINQRPRRALASR